MHAKDSHVSRRDLLKAAGASTLCLSAAACIADAQKARIPIGLQHYSARFDCESYPGRALTIHLEKFSKSNPTAFLGEGDVPWNEVFEACETVGGTQCDIVEYEHPGTPPPEAVARCAENMNEMGKL